MNQTDIIQLAAKHGLLLNDTTVKLNESGVDFLAAHAADQSGQQWILRLPRSEASMRHAERERRLLAVLKEHVTFAVPDWRIFSEELIAYPAVPGTPAATIDPELQDYRWVLDRGNLPEAYYDSLGSTLASLHAVPVHAAEAAGIRIVRDFRAEMERRIDWTLRTYTVHPARKKRWATWLEQEAYWPDAPGVFHGDLHPGHILIDRSSAVTGLIDWTEAGAGDVSTDFASHLLLFGEDSLDRLLRSYKKAGGTVHPDLAAHIRCLLSTSGIITAEYAETVGSRDMNAMAVAMLAQENDW
ncbi:macrolide 2'-phosphotransferase [Alkalicoccus urumqiensis]|uniref:Macrolide 2'-phosphotransferase n=1 Tax=Alkalicoccus urumqiensis TaxID=1548213 RepID=A0A2P6MHI4_ALKUR|nr:macrolide 2'-phosphotransferase [Alkalicoccus urumqiensis]PRO65710.1 macrolide 2'-phosphotransferase [Alkalicoccus urumqiensis]